MRMRDFGGMMLALGLLAPACQRLGDPSCVRSKIDWDAVRVTTTPLREGMYMLRVEGGGLVASNMTVSTGPDGILMVDSGQVETARKTLDAIRRVANGGMKFVINTHWHGDHTCGNASMNRAGAVIIAHENARARIANGSRRTPKPRPGGIPTVTYQDRFEMRFNGQEIDLIHPPNAHTDGDTIVIFRGANVIGTGDIFVNGSYPYIGISDLGGIHGYLAAQERILALADENTLIVPGHGPLARRADLQASMAMMRVARERVLALKAEGHSLEGIEKLNPLADFDARWGRETSFRGRDLAQWIYESR